MNLHLKAIILEVIHTLRNRYYHSLCLGTTQKACSVRIKSDVQKK